MSEQAAPRLAAWKVHGLPVSLPGFSHQPPVQITSGLPSPLRSLTPSPCENTSVPGTFLVLLLGSLMGCGVHGLVGSASGSNQHIWPSGWVAMTSFLLPSPNRSANCGDSLQA